MITLSIKDLHSKTGKWVREASRENIIITDRGEPIAQLRPLENIGSTPFPRRLLSDLPKSKIDSSPSISDERERA